jgi:Flp pilus assembly protein TadD
VNGAPADDGGRLTGTARGDLLLAALAVLVLTTIAFLPCLGNGLTNWDDDTYATANPLVRDLSPGGVGRIFTSFVNGNWHPLTILSHAIDRRLFGEEPRPWHAVNLVLHLGVALLALRLFTALGLGTWAAAGAALLWAVHPTRAETVAWVADRKDLLLAVFSLGSLLAWVGWLEEGRRRNAWLALVLFTLALLSKGTAVTLPIVLLLTSWRRGTGNAGTNSLLRKPGNALIPVFLALAAGAGVMAFLARGSFQGVLQEDMTTPGRLLLGMHRLVWYWLRRAVWPVGEWGLNPFYEDPGRALPGAGWLAGAALVTALLVWLAARSLRQTKRVVWGGAFFLITLAPALPVPVVGQTADRFAYLPAIGLAFLVGALLDHLGTTRGRSLVLAALVAVPALASVPAARERCLIWRDSLSVWTAAATEYPRVPTFRANLAGALERSGRHAEAVEEYTRALALGPSDPSALLGRGAARAALNDLSGARADYERALELDPRGPEGWNNLGVLAGLEGNAGEAVRAFGTAISLRPGYADAHFNRGNIYARIGRDDRAATDYRAALAADPLHEGARRNLSILLSRAGGRTDAEPKP